MSAISSSAGSLDSSSSNPRAPTSSPSTLRRPDGHSSQDVTQESSETTPNPRLNALYSKQTNLEQRLAELQAKRSALVHESSLLPPRHEMPSDLSEEQQVEYALAAANEVLQNHISLLHRYNEIKDIGQGLIGLVAEKRGVRIATIMDEYGMDQND